MTAPASYYVADRADGSRKFHLGALGVGGTSPVPYIRDAFQEAAPDGSTINFPFLCWGQDYTWRPKPIAVVRSPAQLVSKNWMFPYGDTGCALGPVTKYIFTGPGDSGGITKYFPQTGERPDIGLITDASANYMLGRDNNSFLAWAQGAGSCPMHFRDEATGRPVDLLKYPQANANDLPGQGNPFLLKGLPVPVAPIYSDFGDNWHPQQAHYPELSYVAYLATLDQTFLEDLQYSANFTVCTDAAISAHRGIATISGERRGVAWAFRNLFMAHTATLDAEARGALPDTCHPSSYWRTLLDNQLSYYKQNMLDPSNQVFNLFSGPGEFGPWQVDFELMALAFGVLTGHSDFIPIYLWALENAIDRTSGKSGLPPGWGVPYYLDGTKPTWRAAWLAGVPAISGAAPPTPAEIATLTADPLNGGMAMYLNEAMMTTRAVLVTAQYLHAKGLVDVKAAHPDLDLCFANADRMCRSYGAMNPRVSIVLDASQAPTTIPPLPPVTTPQPPTQGNINMTAPALNAPFTATVHFLDDAEVERPVDSVDWSTTGGAHLGGPGHGNSVSGVYAGSGPFEIEAIGHVAGSPDITVKVGGTVPVPFPTHGRIDLS